MNSKEQMYLIRWKSDNVKEVTSGFQVEAIRHSEKKSGMPESLRWTLSVRQHRRI